MVYFLNMFKGKPKNPVRSPLSNPAAQQMATNSDPGYVGLHGTKSVHEDISVGCDCQRGSGEPDYISTLHPSD